jgi:predicted acylesterase/phospholipase RssA
MVSDPTSGGWLSLDAVLETMDNNSVVALAISGGGAAGCYEAGVIDAYMQASFRSGKGTPRIIVGSSAGALNALTIIMDIVSSASTAHSSAAPYQNTARAVWTEIGSQNRGAEFVVGGRAWLLRIITRRRRTMSWVGALVALVWGLAIVAPWFRWWPAAVSAKITPFLVVAVAFAIRMFRRSIFSNRSLRATVANVVDRQPLKRRTNEKDIDAASRKIVGKWKQIPEDRRPDFLITATDLTVGRECLFALCNQTTLNRLRSEEWHVVGVGEPGSPTTLGLKTEHLIDTIVASTSIPGVFPSQQIEILGGRTSSSYHDFVDGGVLNNSPIHAAIDSGATHIVSIELEPLEEMRSDASPTQRGPLGLSGNLLSTFTTLLRETTLTDVRMAAAWNRQLRARAALAACEASHGHSENPDLDQKRLVRLFRIAPRERRIDTIEFDGHVAASPAQSVSLAQWLEEGFNDAFDGTEFWDATIIACPSVDRSPSVRHTLVVATVCAAQAATRQLRRDVERSVRHRGWRPLRRLQVCEDARLGFESRCRRSASRAYSGSKSDALGHRVRH